MNWKDIQVSEDETTFLCNGESLFSKKYQKVLSFHEPGIAPVCDDSGWYHINTFGEQICQQRYDRAFGFYYGFASVVKEEKCFHIDIKGNRTYSKNYKWTGNYQNGVCVVKDFDNKYFHIDKNGMPLYDEKYQYAGDFYGNICCVKNQNGWKHIRLNGNDLNGNYYLELGVFHKSFATARDEQGWYHIDKTGKEIYQSRFRSVEPFYNGLALVKLLNGCEATIDVSGIKTGCL